MITQIHHQTRTAESGEQFPADRKQAAGEGHRQPTGVLLRQVNQTGREGGAKGGKESGKQEVKRGGGGNGK